MPSDTARRSSPVCAARSVNASGKTATTRLRNESARRRGCGAQYAASDQSTSKPGARKSSSGRLNTPNSESAPPREQRCPKVTPESAACSGSSRATRSRFMIASLALTTSWLPTQNVASALKASAAPAAPAGTSAAEQAGGRAGRHHQPANERAGGDQKQCVVAGTFGWLERAPAGKRQARIGRRACVKKTAAPPPTATRAAVQAVRASPKSASQRAENCPARPKLQSSAEATKQPEHRSERRAGTAFSKRSKILVPWKLVPCTGRWRGELTG